MPGLEELLNYGSPINASNKFKIQRQPSSSSKTTIFVRTIGKYTYIWLSPNVIYEVKKKLRKMYFFKRKISLLFQ